MAREVEDTEKNDDQVPGSGSNGKLKQNDEEKDEEEEDEEEEEEDEPRLNYTSLTKNLKPLYRNGDATSAFIVGGDKMVRHSLSGLLSTAMRL